MPLPVECDSCGKRFSVGSERAGRRVRCPACGEGVETGRPRRASRKSSGPNVGLIIGLAAGGLLLLGGLGVAAIMLLRSGGQSAGVAGPADGGGTADGGSQTVVLTPEQKAANEAAYNERLAQQRARSADQERDELVREYGRDKVITVVISNVPGDPVAADRYLNRKVFRAAYRDYTESNKQARAQTEANRKQAADQAVAQHNATFGGFGPTFVHYQYKVVESDLPYPRIINGGRGNGTFTYHALPVLSPEQFAQQLNIGANVRIDHGTRTVYIESQLPDPVPDPDVEEMVIRYGQESVAKVVLTGAEGNADSITYYLETETAKLDPAQNLSVAGMKSLGNGAFEFHVAPVSNLETFAAIVTYGSPSATDAATRTVTLTAKLPADLPRRPTPEELAEIRRKQWEAERNKPQDSDTKPRDGEDFYVWALRVIKGGQHFAVEAALRELKLRDVDPEHLPEVSKVLLATFKDSGSNMEGFLDAMVVWRTDETEKAILSLGGSSDTFHYQDAFMNALTAIGSRDCARALATGLADFHAGDKVVPRLIEVGPVAEEFVLPFIGSTDATVRGRAYTILAEIGTQKSLSKLSSNIRLERDESMKELAKQTHALVKERADALKAVAAEEGDGNAKEDSPFKAKSDGDESPFKDKPGKAGEEANPFKTKD